MKFLRRAPLSQASLYYFVHSIKHSMQQVGFLLILVQAVGPADRSEYFTPFYGPLADKLNPASTYLEISNSTQQCLTG